MRVICFSAIPLILLAVTLLNMLMPRRAFAGEEKHVVILGTSDMHGNVWGYSYEDYAETTNNGMARLYTYIKQVREENPIVFLVDAGDAIQGTIMTDDLANRNPEDEHPMITAMNYMNYDVMTLGNHEFNWGVDVMKQILGQADFPVLCENILNPDGTLITGLGWVIIEREGVRLAVIGIGNPDVPLWDAGKPGIDELLLESVDVGVKKALAEIGDQADIILVSAHVPKVSEFGKEDGSDAGLTIALENPDIDILQLAHRHITEEEEIEDYGTPLVAVINSGRQIARIDVTLDGHNRIKAISTTIVDMADYEPSEEIRELPVVKEMHKKTLNLIHGRDENGNPTAPLGTTTAKFQPENEILGLPELRLRDTPVMDLILNIQLLESGGDVTASSPFKNSSDLPEGAIYYGNIFDIYKYDNTLYMMAVTGKELKNYMEWAVSLYNTWVPGDINISLDPEYRDYLNDQFAGVDYEIDLSRPKGERIKNVRFRGEPLKDDQILKLVINNYRYSSCLKGEDLAKGNYFWESSNSIRDMIVKYFHDHSPVTPVTDNNWRFVGIELSKDDPRRAEIIDYINQGYLPTPYNVSYNLADYDKLVAEAEKNKAEGVTFDLPQSH